MMQRSLIPWKADATKSPSCRRPQSDAKGRANTVVKIRETSEFAKVNPAPADNTILLLRCNVLPIQSLVASLSETSGTGKW